MPGRYGPRTDIVISEEAAKQLEFLVLIERAMMNDQGIPESDIIERMIAAKYEKTRAKFNTAMKEIEEQ